MKIFNFKKIDFLLLVIILILAFSCLLIINLIREENTGTCLISLDGEPYGRYPLNKDQTIEIKTSYGYNQVLIKDGRVSVALADCPDKICLRHKPIRAGYETIICLPHKLVIEIISDQEPLEEVDLIAN